MGRKITEFFINSWHNLLTLFITIMFIYVTVFTVSLYNKATYIKDLYVICNQVGNSYCEVVTIKHCSDGASAARLACETISFSLNFFEKLWDYMCDLWPSLELSKDKFMARDEVFRSQTAQDSTVFLSQMVTNTPDLSINMTWNNQKLIQSHFRSYLFCQLTF